MKAQQTRSHPLASLIKPIGIILLVGAIFLGMFAVIIQGRPAGGDSSSQMLTFLFGLDSTQMWWYVTRAAGLTGYFLIWLSMAWGLAIPSKIVQPVLEGTFTYDFHEYLSLLGLGFILLHITVLLFDKYLPFTVSQLLIPFIDTYRPFWVGLGIIGLYIFLVVTVTFYLRQQIGVKAFRAIHVVSLLGYLGATLHGLFAGTDSSLPITMLLYGGTFLVIVFLTIHWLFMKRFGKDEDQSYATTRANIRGQYQRR